MTATAWSTYTLSLYSRAGLYVRPLDMFQSFSATRTVNAVGSATLTLPYSERLWNQTQKDSVIDVWRQGADGPSRRLMGGIWFVIKRELVLTADGTRTISLVCVDQLDILRRYAILFDSSTAQANKAGTAESIIKGVVTDNLMVASVPKSRLGLAGYLTVEPDAGRGFSPIAIAASWQNCLSVCAQVARSSTQYGAYLCFDFAVNSVGPLALTFFCAANQRGIDRSPSSFVPLLMSDTNGAFGTATYTEDFAGSASFVLCGGQSSAGVTSTATAVDPTLDAVSPFAHSEVYVSQQLSADNDTLATQATDGLRMNRPSLEVSNVTINQSPALRYGTSFDFGDRFTASVGNQMLAVRLESLTVAYGAGSGETISGTLRSEYSP